MFDVSKIRLWIFDADGTLRRCTVPGRPCPNGPGQWELMPGVLDWFRGRDWSRQAFHIVSNQGGVELGLIAPEEAKQLLGDLAFMLPGRQITLSGFCVCESMNPKHPNRKPNPGMLFEAMSACSASRASHIGSVMLDEVAMVGDMESDKEAAERAGVHYVHPAKLFGWD